MSLKHVTLVLLCVCPAVALAQNPPATRPSPWQRPQHRWTGPDSWEEVGAFYAKHSPIRWQMYQEVRDPDRRRFLGGVLRMQYNALKPLETEDPALYRNKLEQIVLEDEVFGYVGRYKAADEPLRGEIQQMIRDRLARLFDLRLQERKRRIAQLEETLAQERQRLEADVNKRESLIQQRVERILRGEMGSLGDDKGMPRFRRPPTRPDGGIEEGVPRDGPGREGPRGGDGPGREGPGRGGDGAGWDGPGRGDRPRPPMPPGPPPAQ